MTGVTLFVDESGRFEPGRGWWPWGMRLVGGPVVPGDAEEAERRCREILDAALEATGLEWWSGEVSGKFLTHPETLAARIGAMSDAPADVRELAERVEAGHGTAARRLKDRGYMWLAELRRHVGAALDAAGGRILLVSESGSPGEGAIPAPRQLRLAFG